MDPKRPGAARLIAESAIVVGVCTAVSFGLGFAWALRNEAATGIDSGNAPGCFLVLGFIGGFPIAAVWAFFRSRNSA